LDRQLKDVTMVAAKWFVGVGACAVLAACGTSSKQPVDRPAWIDGTHARYTPELYITGRGEGRSSDDAGNRARADLAKTFEVRIQEDQKDVQAFSATGESGKAQQSQLEQSVTRSIVTTTDQMLRGVQVVDAWRNPVTLNHHAFAALSRQQAAAGLRQEISRLDDASKLNIDAAANSLDPLDKIAKAHRALDAQIQRLAFQRSLQVVDRSGEGVRAVWSIPQMRNDFEKLLKRTRIRVVVTNDDSGLIKDALDGAIAAAGFTPEDSSAADYMLETSFALEDLGQKSDGWYWVTGALEIRMLDKAGKTRGTKRWPVKASAQQRPLTSQRARDEIARTLEKELRSTVIGFAGVS
jgi:hypothetical protein